jgi:glutamate-1-semialdehyde 2,1-aminomutase
MSSYADEPGRGRYDKSMDLFSRATRVIPSGIYGSKNPGFLVAGEYPYFFTRAEGSRVWDADGNEYIDYMCGFGSQILGYGNAEVDRDALARIGDGDLLPCPPPEMVELAEVLAGEIKGMDWSVFAKNGTDATTLAISLARVHTGKPYVLMAEGAYHGAANWCSSNDYPILKDKAEVRTFPYGDIDALRRLFQELRGLIAAVILTPYHHAVFGDSLMPPEGWYPAVEDLCRRERALFIMDDIRANFRLSYAGSHAHFGANPHMVCMGKAVANGHPLAVLMGRGELKKTAGGFFITGTFWMSAGPIIAALKTLEVLKREGVVEGLQDKGRRFRDGLKQAAASEGYELTVSGPPAIPFVRFSSDPDLYHNQVWASRMAAEGIFVHPHHNMFISHAHSEDDFLRTFEAARRAFAYTREHFGD